MIYCDLKKESSKKYYNKLDFIFINANLTLISFIVPAFAGFLFYTIPKSINTPLY